jgi:hypothetical protein
MVRMPCVAAVLNWRNENNKSGLYPVHIRIKIGNTARYYHVPIPQKIKKDQWAGKDNNWINSLRSMLEMAMLSLYFGIDKHITDLDGWFERPAKRNRGGISSRS